MGSNNGTGWPIFFRCSVCKKKPWLRTSNDIRRTGKTRPYTGGNKGVRGLDTFHQYKCMTCNHVGWTRHVDILRRDVI